MIYSVSLLHTEIYAYERMHDFHACIFFAIFATVYLFVIKKKKHKINQKIIKTQPTLIFFVILY